MLPVPAGYLPFLITWPQGTDGNAKRVLPAKSRPLAQYKTATEAAVSVDTVLFSYAAFLRLAIPTRPSRPEPSNQTVAGRGTTVLLDDDHEKVTSLAVCPVNSHIPGVNASSFN